MLHHRANRYQGRVLSEAPFSPIAMRVQGRPRIRHRHVAAQTANNRQARFTRAIAAAIAILQFIAERQNPIAQRTGPLHHRKTHYRDFGVLSFAQYTGDDQRAHMPRQRR